MASFRKRHSRKYRNKNTRRTKNRRNARKSHIKRRSKKSLRGGGWFTWSNSGKDKEDLLAKAIQDREKMIEEYNSGRKEREEQKAKEVADAIRIGKEKDEIIYADQARSAFILQHKLRGNVGEPSEEEIQTAILRERQEREASAARELNMTKDERAKLDREQVKAAFARRYDL